MRVQVVRRSKFKSDASGYFRYFKTSFTLISTKQTRWALYVGPITFIVLGKRKKFKELKE